MGVAIVGYGGSPRGPAWGACGARAAAVPDRGGRLSNDELCRLIDAVAHARDRAAFVRLFEYFAPRLKAFGMRKGVDPAAAEELAQETMLTVWRRADLFDPRRASAATWVFTIVRNKRIDLYRRAVRPEVDLDAIADLPDQCEGPEAQLGHTEAGAAVRAAMSGLPAEQVEVLHKAFFEDKPHSVIADELRLPLGTVKSRIRLGLARLRGAIPEGVR